MNQLSTRPPTERELPAGRSTELRARVMAYADSPRPRASRIAPIAASVAVLAVAAGTVLVVQSHNSKHNGQPGSTTVTLDDATLAARCGLPGGQVLVRFTDRFGGYAVVARATDQKDCFFGLTGLVRGGGSSSGGSVPGPASTKWQVNLVGWGDGASAWTGAGPEPSGSVCIHLGTPPLTGKPPSVVRTIHADATAGPRIKCLPDDVAQQFKPGHEVLGVIAPDVARVTVTWAGRAPVAAAIHGHFFAARYVDADGEPQQVPGPDFTVRAYDAAEHLLRQLTQQD